jgi:4-hydroxybenzoate polyprenyltransferase
MMLSPGKQQAMTTIRLFRPVNLAIMAATLFLVRYCIFLPVFRQNGLEGMMPWWQFLLLVAATLLIAAGGYVINDVLDIELDKINKPSRQIIGNGISENSGKNLHFNLTAAGVVTGLAFSYLSGNIFLGILFVIIPTSLYYYSLKYKYLPFVGNFVVALLSAFVVIIYWVFEFYFLKEHPEAFIDASRYFYQLNRLLLGFAAFAFLVSLVREMIKDLQDLEGDSKQGALTLPVVIGLRNTKLLAAGLLIATIAGLAWYQLIMAKSGYRQMAIALMLAQLLLTFTLVRTFMASTKSDFGRISAILKWAMAAGMLSMAATWLKTIA